MSSRYREDIPYRALNTMLRASTTQLKTASHTITDLYVNLTSTVGCGWIQEGNPEDGKRFGVYRVDDLKMAINLAESHGAEKVHLVEGPKSDSLSPVLVLLSEVLGGHVSRYCIVVSPSAKHGIEPMSETPPDSNSSQSFDEVISRLRLASTDCAELSQSNPNRERKAYLRGRAEAFGGAALMIEEKVSGGSR